MGDNDQITQNGSASQGAESQVDNQQDDQQQAGTDDNQQQPLTQEQITQMINEAVNQQTEAARREIQSVKDKATAEVKTAQDRAKLAETTLKSVEGTVGQDDPDTAQSLELAKLRAQQNYYQNMENDAAKTASQRDFDGKFHNQMSEFVQSLGADANDKRIDWGQDSNSYLEKQQRILRSVAKIQKEEAKVAEEKRSQEAKDLENRLRKELGLDSVDTTNPPVKTEPDQKETLKAMYPTMFPKK